MGKTERPIKPGLRVCMSVCLSRARNTPNIPLLNAKKVLINVSCTEIIYFILSLLRLIIIIIIIIVIIIIIMSGSAAQCGLWPPPSTKFRDHTQRRATVSRNPLDEWSARRRDLNLTTHNTHNRQTFMPRWDSNPRSQQASSLRPTP
jgi:hypothetical protein